MCAPKVYAVIACAEDVLDSMLKTVEVVFSGVRFGLREFDTGESNIWPVGGHGHSQDKFADASLIFDIHLLSKTLLVARVSRSNSGIKLLDPCRVGRERSGPVFSCRHFVKPRIEVLLAELINIAAAVDLDIIVVSVMSILLNMSNRPCCFIGIDSWLSR